MASPPFDVLTTTATELSGLLNAGEITSAALVEIYLAEIEKSNAFLKAVITTAPRSDLMQRAKTLDHERSRGKTRSKFHGLPVLVKDNMATHPDLGMLTTAGAFGLVDSRPKKTADIVERLIDAGLVILGKTNLSELSGWKGSGLRCGWSAVGGQSQSAYVRGGVQESDSPVGHSTPGGSSSGSAIAVSAGMAPLSLGTETSGSLISPAGRAALYTIKPTVGTVSRQGIVPVSHLCDSAGPMAKCVRDMANLLDIIVDPASSSVPQGGYATASTTSWADLKVGTLDLAEWKADPTDVKSTEQELQEMETAFRNAYSKIKGLARACHQHVPLPNSEALQINGENCLITLYNGYFKGDFDSYVSSLEYSSVRKLEELVEFNRKHATAEFPPEQDRLENALSHNLTEKTLIETLAHARRIGRKEGVDKILKEYGIDVIIGPAESAMPSIASASGYPIASLPLGYLSSNGRPFAMAALASGHQEAVLVKVQSAWEATFGPRQPPPRENFQL